MQIYDSLDVDLTYQNFGSAWLGILRGSAEHINLTCNGLFNLRATNGRQEYHNEEKTIATFWTSEDAMLRFFYNKHYLPREMERSQTLNLLRSESDNYAQSQIVALEPSHEEFMTFEGGHSPTTFSSGTIAAERPDTDMKDAIMTYAFADTQDAAKKVDIDVS